MAVETLSDIKQLITPIKIAEALEALAEIFGEENFTFSNFLNEYFNPPNNFEITNFCGRLKIFVGTQKRFISSFLKENSKDQSTLKASEHLVEDSLFDDLASLDFVSQERKIIALMRERCFGAFVLRGNGEYGQRWVIHQVRQKAFPSSKCIPIGSIGGSLELDHIINTIKTEAINANYLEDDEQSYKLECLAEALPQSLTNDLILVIDDEASFLLDDQFKLFYSHFIKRITPRMRGNAHKIIIFLVDKENYTHEVFCEKPFNFWFYGDDHGKSELEFIDQWKDRDGFQPYLVALHQIQQITLDMMKAWKDNLINRAVLQRFESDDDIDEFLSQECENGNPHQVMLSICKVLNYPEKWLSY